MEQEQINIEDIMQEIRAEIRAKGYADNEIPFSDIACWQAVRKCRLT